MSKEKSSFLKFGLGVMTGFGFVLALSPTAREICKEKTLAAVEVAKPYVQEGWTRLLNAVEAGKEAALKKEEELEEEFQSMSQESLEQEEPPDYII